MGKVEIAPAGRVPAFNPLRRCSGCGRCVAACPEKLYTLEVSDHRKHAVQSAAGRCSRCGSCVDSCPLEVLAAETLST